MNLTCLASASDGFAMKFGLIAGLGRGPGMAKGLAFWMVLVMFLSMVGLDYTFPINQAYMKNFLRSAYYKLTILLKSES
jgi:hypothetical protein